MASEPAFSLTCPQRKMVSAIQQMISVAELSANRGDHRYPQESVRMGVKNDHLDFPFAT
jgi:hypothetical protein